MSLHICFEWVTNQISKTCNNFVHCDNDNGNDNDDDNNDNIDNEQYICCLIFCCIFYICTWIYTFRHILASLHFNENLHRDTQLSKNGEKYFKVTYPKYKLGEEVVREVASPPTYGELNYSTMCNYDYSAVIVSPDVIPIFFIFLCLFFCCWYFWNE